MQELLKFTPEHPEQLSGLSFVQQVEEKLKSVATNRTGNAKPSDIQNDEVWGMKNPDGTIDYYVWREKDGTGNGTLLQNFFAATEILEDEAQNSDEKHATQKAVNKFTAVYVQKYSITSEKITNEIDSESEETVASSKAVKLLHDKMGKVQLIEEINSNSTIPQVMTLTDLIPYRPIFMTVTNTETINGAHVEFHAVSGTFNDIAYTGNLTDGRFRIATSIGSETGYKTTPTAIFIPYQETAKILISRLNGANPSQTQKTTVKFFQ